MMTPISPLQKQTLDKIVSNLDKETVAVSSNNSVVVNQLSMLSENLDKASNFKKVLKKNESRELPKNSLNKTIPVVKNLIDKKINKMYFPELKMDTDKIKKIKKNIKREKYYFKNKQKKRNLILLKAEDITKNTNKRKNAMVHGTRKISVQKTGKKRKNTDMPSQNKYLVDSKIDSKFTLSDSGFSWSSRLEDINQSIDVSSNETENIKGPSKRIKKIRVGKEEEAQLREIEQTLIVSEANPKTVDQFDRAVLTMPDDADLWIKYMGHHLQATEIEKARSVARRALQMINQRHEVERMNVWIAFLNMEHLFGTQETLKECLTEAFRTNDEFTISCKMLQIYSNSNKLQNVKHLVSTMIQKFSNSVICWIHCCSALMKCDQSDQARQYLQQAISILPPKQHILLLCKFALLENQHGFIEQAQTLFEHVLTSYPKRSDVWNIYVDMLVKANKIESARQILKRAIRQSLPARKMKMLFSKWLDFEEKHGNAENVEQVRKQAEVYIKSFMKKLQ